MKIKWVFRDFRGFKFKKETKRPRLEEIQKKHSLLILDLFLPQYYIFWSMQIWGQIGEASFILLTWVIWKEKNIQCFDIYLLRLLWDYLLVLERDCFFHIGRVLHESLLVFYSFGYVKLNFDGCVFGNPGLAGVGAIIHESPCGLWHLLCQQCELLAI